MKDAGHGAERRIGLLEAPDAVEVAKELVCAVNEMDNHKGRGQESEIRSQRSEVQRSEVRDQG
jgi:hypothetical protein